MVSLEAKTLMNIDLFDIDLLAKKLQRAKTHLEYDQLLYKIAAQDTVDTIVSYNKIFTNALDLSFFPQPIINSCDKISNLTVATDIFASESLKNNVDASKYDLIISNLSIQSINNITTYLATIYNLLEKDGIFIGSCFGSQTLQELLYSMMHAETSLQIAHTPNIIPLLDIQKIGNLLQKIGFKAPVVDSNIYTLEYKNIYDLCSELRKMGLTNHMHKRRKGFLSKKFWQTLNQIHQDSSSASIGLQNSFEVLSFIAKK